MKSADLWDREDAPARWRLHVARMGAVVVEGLMRARGVVVREVTAQQASEMPFVEHDDVIEAFPSNRPDDALREWILPGRAWGDEDLANPHAFHPPCEHVAVDGVAIAEQVLGRCLFREALDKLLDGPGGGWVVGDVDMHEFSPVVPKDQEPEEQAEGEGGNDEEVEGDNVTDMRLKEGAPRRGWPRRGAPHVLRDRELSHVVTEEPKLGLDAAPAPREILASHAANQVTDLAIDPRAPGGASSRFPTPVELKALAMPGKDSGGLNDQQAGPPARPEA